MIKYDKLKSVTTDETFFNFKCQCGAKGDLKNVFDIKPVGVSWKPNHIDNSDIKNDYIRQQLDLLPNLRKAIESVMNESDNFTKINITCNKCNNTVVNYNSIKVSDIRKWLNKHEPLYMEL